MEACFSVTTRGSRPSGYRGGTMRGGSPDECIRLESVWALASCGEVHRSVLAAMGGRDRACRLPLVCPDGAAWPGVPVWSPMTRAINTRHAMPPLRSPRTIMANCFLGQSCGPEEFVGIIIIRGVSVPRESSAAAPPPGARRAGARKAPPGWGP